MSRSKGRRLYTRRCALPLIFSQPYYHTKNEYFVMQHTKYIVAMVEPLRPLNSRVPLYPENFGIKE